MQASKKTATRSPQRSLSLGPSGGPGADRILHGLTTAVVVTDARLVVTCFNSAAEHLLGVSRRLAVGRQLERLFVPSRDVVALCQRAVKTGITCGTRELAVRIGGRETRMNCRAAPLEGPGGSLILELFDTDRDRQVRREAELTAQRRASRRIIQQLAHEVKNPLGGLRGAAQLLARQLPDARLNAYTDVIIEEADRLAALVDTILKPGGPRKTTVFSLHEVTEHVAKLIVAEKPPGVRLSRDYDPSLPPTTADRDQLIQAYLNLAKNALQAVGQEGRLVFRTRALSNFSIGGKRYRLVLSAEVEDSGPGIPEELRGTIFFPLITGRTTGSGLGLPIAQDLVSRNGGLVEFESAPGATVFQMRLPAVTDVARTG